MTIHEVLAILRDKGNNPTNIVSIVTKTQPPLLKKGRVTKTPCPHTQGVERLVIRYGIIGCNYQSCVNRQRERENQPINYRGQLIPFRAESLWHGYGEHVPDSPYLVRHKKTGDLYLAFLPFNRDNEPSVGEEIWTDIATGAVVNPETLTEFLKLPGSHAKQQTDKIVFWRTIGVENIVQIKCGEEYPIYAVAS